jgi:dimethyl sulfoxide reductase membrane subunit
MTTTTKNSSLPTPLLGWILMVVIGLGGIGVSWGLQLTQGIGITSLSQQVVWGLYIGGFFAVLGAGAALVSLAAVSEFSNLLLPVALRKNALLLALSSFVVGGLFIVMDVGNPINLWRILTAGRFTSMMTWDFFALIVTGLLTLAYLAAIWKQSAPTAQSHALGIAALAASVLLVIIEGWMLATMSAHPLWAGGLTVLSFLIFAFIAGLAVSIFAWPQTAPRMGNWLKISLWVSLAIVLMDLITALLANQVRPFPDVSLLIAGALSPMFWLYLVIGVLAPLALLIWQKDALWVRAAAVLAFLGVFAEKLWLLSAGQALPLLPFKTGVYFPSWIEYLGVIGSIVFGVLVYRLLVLFFKPE